MAEETKEAVKTEEKTEELDLKRFLSSMRLSVEVKEPVPMIQDNLQIVKEDISEEDRFLSGMAALLLNVDKSAGRLDKGGIQELIARIDQTVNDQINDIIHHADFKKMESNWRSLNDLILNTNFKADIMIDILDVDPEELFDDFEANAVDITGSALFKKVYVSEYDQYGGKPYGAIIGFHEFVHTPHDEFWLKTMGKIAAASHAPFIGSASPKFFGCDSIEELAAIKDLEGLLNHPKYGSWNKLRDSAEAAYIGLALPRYVSRLPYDPEINPCREIVFEEAVRGDNDQDYVWGNAASLFAQNMVRSFAQSGWCQYLRGPKGGGLVPGLPVHTFNVRGEDEIKIPVEMAIPDYRELEFANCGFMPLVYRKGTADACFFSCQSLKKPKKFKDPKDSENSQLVTNLSYTFSITRIAHYVKSIMRDNIGSSDLKIQPTCCQGSFAKWISTFASPMPTSLPSKLSNTQRRILKRVSI